MRQTACRCGNQDNWIFTVKGRASSLMYKPAAAAKGYWDMRLHARSLAWLCETCHKSGSFAERVYAHATITEAEAGREVVHIPRPEELEADDLGDF